MHFQKISGVLRCLKERGIETALTKIYVTLAVRTIVNFVKLEIGIVVADAANCNWLFRVNFNTL